MNYYFILLLAFSITKIISAKDYKAEILNFETRVEVSGKKLIKNYKYAIKINNREGDALGNISIPFSSMVKVSKISGYVKDWQGNVVKKIKKSDLKAKSDLENFSFYEDHFEYEITLKHYSYPYVIHCAYQEEQSEFLSIDYWSPVMDTDIPTRNATLEVILPKNYKIHTWLKGIEEAKPTPYKSNFQRYFYRDQYTNIVKEERNAPDIRTILPVVKIVPSKFMYDKPGSFESWVSFGNWKYSIKENLDVLPDSEKQKIDQLIKGITDTTEIVKIVYHYLQDHTRYVYVGLETGGMKPFPASYVAEKKYGDCKALSNYFNAMLTYVGIPSYYSIIYAGSTILPVNTNFPSSQFNHIISCVPLQHDTIWLDSTSKLAFNYLGSFTQNRNTFLIEKDGSRFVKTPAMQPEDVLEIRKIDLVVDTFGFVKLKGEKLYKGPKYENLYYLNTMHGAKDRDQAIRNYWVENGLALKNYSIKHLHRDSTCIGLQYEAISGTPFESFGNEMLIEILPFGMAAYEKPENRTMPVQINYPIAKIDTLLYHLPDKIALKSLPENIEFTTEFGNYSLKIHPKGDKIQVIKSMTLYSGFIPLEKYEAFYRFVQRIYNKEYKSYLITNKNASHKNIVTVKN